MAPAGVTPQIGLRVRPEFCARPSTLSRLGGTLFHLRRKFSGVRSTHCPFFGRDRVVAATDLQIGNFEV
jgi:hypothetical protein